MHDFCFTIPYGFAVLAGGVLGYLRRGSTASLAGGAGAGALLLLAGFVSLKAFQKRRNSYVALALETHSLCISLNFRYGAKIPRDFEDYASWCRCWSQCRDVRILSVQNCNGRQPHPTTKERVNQALTCKLCLIDVEEDYERLCCLVAW
uniref:Transmembrane protein 14C n=1 Tax=Zea mays TaxID=4577 RepID=A0A804PA45_MAIZE